MKKLLLSLFSTIFIAICTAICIIVPQKIKYDNFQEQQKAQENESGFNVMNIVESALKAENYTGKIKFNSYDNSTNVLGDLKINKSNKMEVELRLSGTINNCDTTCIISYINNTIYFTYNNIKLYSSTSDAIYSIKTILSAININTEEMLDVSIFSDYINKIETTETSTGFDISAKLPYLNNLLIRTDREYFPTLLVANCISISDKYYYLKIELESNSSNYITEPLNSEYINIEPSKTMISAIIKTYYQLPIKLNGEIEINNVKVPIQLIIDEKFNIKFDLITNSVPITGYYIDNKIYLSLSNTNIILSYDEFSQLIGPYINLKNTSALYLTSLSSDAIIFNDSRQISFDYRSDGSIKTVFANFGTLSATLYTSQTDETILVPVFSKYLTFYDLKSILQKYERILENEFSFYIEGSYGGTSVIGQAHISTNDFKTLNQFYFYGKLNNEKVLLAYIDNCYYLSINSFKAKFSNACINELWSILQKQVSIPKISLQDLYLAFTSSIKSLNIEKSGTFTLSFAGANQLVLYPQYNETIVKLNNFAVNNHLLSATINIYNNLEYKTKLLHIDTNSFKDYSNSSTFASAVLNTLNSKNYTLSGSLNLSLWGISLKNLPISLTCNNYGKQSIVIKIDNLPVTLFLTPYNAITYKKQTLTLTLQDTQITIKRQVYKRFSTKVITALNETREMSTISKSDLPNILGIKKSLLDNAGSGNFDSSKLVLLNTLSFANTKMGLSLGTSIFVKGLSDCKTSINYDSKITSISASINYLHNLKIVLKLNKG